MSKPDFLAIISVGGGSSWGRSPYKEEAIQLAMKHYRDWDVYFDIYDKDIKINVVDVQGYKDCSWGAGGKCGKYWLYGTNAITGKQEPINRKIEVVDRHMPPKRERKRRRS